MKKVSIFGKSIPVLVLALITIGLASAGLLTYYGMVVGTVNVEQSVKLDGKSCDTGCSDTDEVSGVAGSQLHGDVHSLTNANPDIDAIVSLDLTTTCPEGDCAGLTVAPKFRLDAVESDDNDDLFVIPPTDVWNNFNSVSFDYFITEDSTYTNTPHVNIALRDAEGNALCVLVSNEMSTSKGEWKTAIFDKAYMESGTVHPMISGGCDNKGILKFNSVSIEVADGAGPITSDQVQTVWVKNVKVNGVDNLWFRVPHPYTGDNIPARIIHFVMGYDFAMNAYPGTYTVNTEVTPRGTYTQGFTWTP